MKININYKKSLLNHNTLLFENIIYLNFLYLKKYKNLKHTKMEIKRLLNSNNSYLFTVIINNKIIGYLLGEIKILSDLNPLDNRKVFYISYLYVCQKHRNKHIGNKLLNTMYCFFKKSNIDGFLLTFDTRIKKNKNFYEKNHFMPDNIFRTYDKFDVYYKNN